MKTNNVFKKLASMALALVMLLSSLTTYAQPDTDIEEIEEQVTQDNQDEESEPTKKKTKKKKKKKRGSRSRRRYRKEKRKRDQKLTLLRERKQLRRDKAALQKQVQTLKKTDSSTATDQEVTQNVEKSLETVQTDIKELKTAVEKNETNWKKQFKDVLGGIKSRHAIKVTEQFKEAIKSTFKNIGEAALQLEKKNLTSALSSSEMALKHARDANKLVYDNDHVFNANVITNYTKIEPLITKLPVIINAIEKNIARLQKGQKDISIKDTSTSEKTTAMKPVEKIRDSIKFLQEKAMGNVPDSALLPDRPTWNEIKKTYRKLSVKFHPDKKGGDEEVYKQIREAYEFLEKKEQGGHLADSIKNMDLTQKSIEPLSDVDIADLTPQAQKIIKDDQKELEIKSE